MSHLNLKKNIYPNGYFNFSYRDGDTLKLSDESVVLSITYKCQS